MTARPRTVLIVDDDVFSRLFAAQVVSDAGFTVVEADCSVEALDVLDTHDGVSIMITDVCMPGDRDGLALARKVATTHPAVSIIIVSGQVRPGFGEIPGGARFLAKPYTAHGLMDMISRP